MRIIFKLLLRALFLIFLAEMSWSQALSIGSFSIGKSSVQVDLGDFTIEKNRSEIKAQFEEDSLQWIRTENNLLTPRVLLKISVPASFSPTYIKSGSLVFFPVKDADQLSTKIYVNLFNPEKIQIFQNEVTLDTIEINAKSVATTKRKQWVDYSCYPYQVKIAGAETEYSSTGCLMSRIGEFGLEKPRLDVIFSSPNLRTPAGDQPPFLFSLSDNSEVETILVHKHTGVRKKMKVSAVLPERMRRLKTALGLGPYFFTNISGDSKKGPETAPSLMVYGKFDLSDTSSLRAFDALIYNEAFFNNSGLYFSYDLARVLDGQVIFGALLGFQGLHYRFGDGYPTVFEMIYPQGFELIYNNAFGIKNNYLNFGAFLSTTQEIYKNIWVRFGSKVFYEINYIKWGHETSEMEMWGLSVGFPLFKAF